MHPLRMRNRNHLVVFLFLLLDKSQ